MAAVLCGAIGDLTKGACTGIGKVITLPCRACGFACNSITDLLTTAFFPYILVTFGLNMPGLYYGAKSLNFDCPSLSKWLVTNGLLCLIHMVAALYIVRKVRETPSVSANAINNGDPESPSTDYNNFSIPKENEQGAANSMARIKHVLCYDKTMALYIIFFIGWLVWLSSGIAKRLGADAYDACGNEVQHMNVAISCGYMYFSLVFVAFGCSLCCLR